MPMPTPVFVHLGDRTLNLAAVSLITYSDRGAIVRADGARLELGPAEAAALHRLLSETPSGCNPAFKVVSPCTPPIETPHPEAPADDGDDWSTADRDGVGPVPRGLAGAFAGAMVDGLDGPDDEAVAEAAFFEALTAIESAGDGLAGTEAVGEVRGGPVS